MEQKNGTYLNDLVHLSFFAEIGKAITSTTSINETLREVMNQIGNIFAPMYWSLLLRDSRTGELKFIVVIGSGVEKLKGKVLPRGRGIAGWIAERGQPAIIEDVSKDERFDPSMDQLTGFKTRSIIGVPLKTENKVFGVIELINKLNGESFTPLELKVLSTIADFTAIAIEKAYYLKALKKIAAVDPLTGTLNRRTMVKYLEREKDRCKRHGSKFSILMIDIDKFKQINDNYGHSAGDKVLKTLAEMLSNNVRKIDYIFRYGGDEFVILLPDTDKNAAEEIRRRILKEVDKYNSTQNEIIFSISVGMYTGCPEETSEIIKVADEDMYQAKYRNLERDIASMPQNLEMFLEEEQKEKAKD